MRANAVPDRGQVDRIEVGVDHHQRPGALTFQRRGHIGQQRREGGRAHGDRPREAGREGGGGVGEGREKEGVEAESPEPRQRGDGGGPGNHHIRDEGEVGAVRLDRADR